MSVHVNICMCVHDPPCRWCVSVHECANVCECVNMRIYRDAYLGVWVPLFSIAVTVYGL